MIAAGLILMLTLTSLLPAAPPALAQAPQGNSAPAGPNAVESGGPYVFALPAKDSKLFYRYDISANAWAKMADIPAKVQWGGALTTDGTYIYALPAKDTQLFYRYDISANTWTARANIPAKVKDGGALTFDGTVRLCLVGQEQPVVLSLRHHRQQLDRMTANIPSNVNKTGALTTLGSYIYGLPSKDTQAVLSLRHRRQQLGGTGAPPDQGKGRRRTDQRRHVRLCAVSQ